MTTTLSRRSASLQSDRRRSRQQLQTKDPATERNADAGSARHFPPEDGAKVVRLRSAKPSAKITAEKATSRPEAVHAPSKSDPSSRRVGTKRPQVRTKGAAGNKPNTQEKRWPAPVGLLCAAASIYLGWKFRDVTPLSAEQGLGYWLGVVSVTCMSTLLIYPIRKRIRWLRFIGPIKNWFRIHMTLGVLAPLAALYHCNFQLGSLNSQIALYCMLAVAASGLVGRLLYHKIHRSLYGRQTDFRALRIALQSSKPKPNRALPFLPMISQRLAGFDEGIFIAGKKLGPSIKLALRVKGRARREQKALLNFAAQQLAKSARQQPQLRRHHSRILGSLEHYLNRHMQQAVRLGRIQAYERLFALWHLVHLPFFVVMLLTVVVHVAAVHLY